MLYLVYRIKKIVVYFLAQNTTFIYLFPYLSNLRFIFLNNLGKHIAFPKDKLICQDNARALRADVNGI